SKHSVRIHRWILRFHRDRVPLDVLAREDANLQTVRTMFAEWNKQLDRKSCYTSWPPALDYQASMVRMMREHFDELDTTGVLTEMAAPAEILDAISRDQRLTPVDGPARRNMTSYLEEQFERLR